MLFFDIEVQVDPEKVSTGWDDPWALGFASAVAYQPDADEYFFFGPDDKDSLIRMLTNEKIGVGFNNIRFDNAVLVGDQPHPWHDIDLLRTVVRNKFDVAEIEDAYQKVGIRGVHDGTLSLDALCRNTIKMAKNGHGAYAPTLYQEGRWAELFQYNLHDVRLTVQLYNFMRKYQYVIDGRGKRVDILESEKERDYVATKDLLR